MAQQLPLIALAATLLASCATMPQTVDAEEAAKLSAALAGKVAGSPQSCIRLDDARGATVYRDAIVYRASRRLTYVNASPGCRSWDSDPIFVNEVSGSQLCRGDLVRTLSRDSGIPGPVCVLGDFTPYRSAPKPG